jgi:hypothetical protein
VVVHGHLPAPTSAALMSRAGARALGLHWMSAGASVGCVQHTPISHLSPVLWEVMGWLFMEGGPHSLFW